MQNTASSYIELSPEPGSRPFTPAKGRILIQRDDAEEKIGSIYVPETSQDRPMRGVVRAIGEGVHDVRVGDRLHYSAKGRPDYLFNGLPCQLIVEADVFGVEE